MRKQFLLFSFISVAAILIASIFYQPLLWLLFGLLPVIFFGLRDMYLSNNPIVRNFPIFGHGRFLMEELRPKIQQYFIESDTNGTPINRISRSVVYQRSEKALDSAPFGTQLDIYQEGYEWMNHSINSLNPHTIDQHPRIEIGNMHCKQPYSASILNVSAMSFGSLSARAIEALNGGAKIGNFAHNTGEGGVSPYHLNPGGDLIWQIGTGYFGCRNAEGNFDDELFKKTAANPSIKMIELKLSQGAKPGHGGILPGKKVTAEIAKIRNVKEGETVYSHPYHTAFQDFEGLINFVQKLRDLSEGKPVGFKLCIGSKDEFHTLCKTMIRLRIFPDFIAIDGGEGGTGAAPLEFTNSVGMPYKDGLAFAYNCLVGYNIKQHIKILAAGKITTAFHIFKTIAIGADACYSARAMMLSLGCIQALECNNNSCPTGIATQDKSLMQGLVVKDKKIHVANYHEETMEALVELLAAAGLKHTNEITRKHVNRRTDMTKYKRFDEIYGNVKVGEYLYGKDEED